MTVRGWRLEGGGNPRGWRAAAGVGAPTRGAPTEGNGGLGLGALASITPVDSRFCGNDGAAGMMGRREWRRNDGGSGAEWNDCGISLPPARFRGGEIQSISAMGVGGGLGLPLAGGGVMMGGRFLMVSFGGCDGYGG